jgi:two-component system response regulator NreC
VPITLVLADDHEVMRSGLRRLLEDEDDFRVVAEAGDVLTTFRLVRMHNPDVLVLDLNMPGGGSSLDMIGRMAPNFPGTSIVVLTMEEDRTIAREALAAGAKGYVLKHAAATELVDVIRGVVKS